MKKVIMIFTLIFLLTGCTEKEKVIDELKSEAKDQINIVVFVGRAVDEKSSMTSDDFSKRINDLIDENSLSDKINSLKFVDMNADSPSNDKYEDALELNEYPYYFVFDDKDIVLQTDRFEELQRFFLVSIKQ